MAWRADVLYGPNTPALRAALAADEVLGPQLCVIPPEAAPQSGLPSGGLLAVRDILPPEEIAHADAVPWDALLGPEDQALRLPSPAELPEVSASLWPPRRALQRLASLAEAAGAPLAYHRGETWGGTLEHEVTWVLGPAHVLVAHGAEGTVLIRDRRRESIAGDALMVGLTEIGLQMDSGFFEPHTGTFDWAETRLHPPAPRSAPLPPQPRSLHRCVALGDLAQVRRLLGRGADPNAYARRRPLELAAAQGDAALLQLLLDHGAEVENGGFNPLRVASNAAVARALLRAGAPAQSALVDAARAGRAEVVDLLIEAGVTLDFQADGQVLWLAVCAGGLLPLAERGLASGLDLHARRSGLFASQSAVELAAAGGHGPLLRWLLAQGGELSEASVLACAQGDHAELLAELLDRGGRVEATRHGRHALYEAARAGALASVRLLLDRGAPVDGRTRSGDSALHGAALTGQRAVVEALLQAGASVDARDDSGYSPLWSATGRGDQEIVDRLLAAGADPDISNRWGTPLRTLAAQRGVRLPPPRG
ncbi:MAG: ankyrin repeat domain-containing protein [Alphaproteobacteria bacterium]|nr:ankyrin repeat domain-containing protein [Alphaproteobacteria bacterium]MCB9794316.1 ankyrin repeat domain-containing protein [Alphaproteobacteria bacterium]